MPIPMNRSWYFTRRELEHSSPSRRDGISVAKESNLRSQYCSHIQNVGHSLTLPSSTIATAMMLCHRFYARQSHAKNCWHTVASSCLLLASKVQDTPQSLRDVVTVVYCHEINDTVKSLLVKYNINDVRERDEIGKKTAKNLRRKKKELLLAAERIVLKTIGFDFDVEHPYKPLLAALKRVVRSGDKITGRLTEMAWSLVEEWLKTSMCLQYKARYIAVGSVVVAARILDVKLPAGENWLEELGVLPEVLDEVIRRMQGKIGQVKTKEVISVVSFYEITSSRWPLQKG